METAKRDKAHTILVTSYWHAILDCMPIPDIALEKVLQLGAFYFLRPCMF
jgi:hypothetical protein